MPTARLGCGHGIAWTVLLAAAGTSSAGPKCPSSRVLHGLGALAKPGAKRQTQEGVAGWPDFDPDFAEEPGLIEPYLSDPYERHPGIPIRIVVGGAQHLFCRQSHTSQC